MKSLELFSGSKSVSSVFKSLGFDTWSVDNNPLLSPRVCCDILEFDYSLFPSHFDVIWASPDCCYFSRESSLKHWNKELLGYRRYSYTPASDQSLIAYRLLVKTIEIIKHYLPGLWFIENPVGRMRHFKELQNFAPFRYGVNYKDFGFSYSKETDIYSNVYLNLPQKKVIRPGLSVKSLNNSYDRSVVPPALVEFLVKPFTILL